MRSTARSGVNECLAAAGWHHRRRRRLLLRQSADRARMTETMRREGHKALVHYRGGVETSARCSTRFASRMAFRSSTSCAAGEADILHKIGAKFVVDSAAPTFMDDLTNALVATGATIAFDAIGGGRLAGQILTCMENAANKTAKGLQPLRIERAQAGLHLRQPRSSPVELNRAFAWPGASAAGLLFPFLMKIGPADGAKLRQRVVSETQDTFASHYTKVGVAAGSAAARQHRRLRQARHRREVL